MWSKMRWSACLACVAVVSAGLVGHAKPVSDPSVIAERTTVLINFSELRDKDDLLFGSPQVGQPYAKLGLVLPSQKLVADANLTPELPVAVQATGVSTINNASYQSLAFTQPQRIVGFTVSSPKATQIIVTALDRKGEVLDVVLLPPSQEAQFVGFMRDEADITVIRVVAPHATMGDALESPTMISGIALSGGKSEEENEALAADLGVGSAVGAFGVGIGQGASASVSNSGFGAGGRGGSAGSDGGRNPGNRNPNLPPALLPEPAALGLLAPLAVLTLRRRR